MKPEGIYIRLQNIFFDNLTRFLFIQNQIQNEPKKILILRTSALGDFLFAVPGMAALRKRFPLAKITLLTTSTTQAGTRNAVKKYIGESASFPWLSFVKPSIIDDAICFDSVNPKIILKEIKPRIKNLQPDMTFILSHPGDPGIGLFKKIIFLKALGVSKNVYGWRMRSSISFLREPQYKAGLFEHKIFGPLRAITESQLMPRIQNIEIAFPLDIDSDSEKWIQTFLSERGLDGANIVAVAPGSIQPHKRWPEEKFISLCQQLIGSYGVVIVIIGTKNDYALGKRLKDNLNENVLNLAGVTNIPQVAALLKRCTLLVGNDGGAMHLGAAMGCKTISIIPGIEYPGSVEPWGNFDLAVRHDISCSPCYSFIFCPQKHNKCMTDIPVKGVLNFCIKILDNKRGNFQKKENHELLDN